MKKTIGSQTETNGTVLAALGAGTICNMITNPLSVIRARMLLSDKTSCGKGSYDTLGRTLAHIARNEGISGFYKVLFNYLLSNRAATAGKAGKVWSLPRFWVSICSYKKQPVKKFLDRILDLAWLQFSVAVLQFRVCKCSFTKHDFF